MKVRGISLHLRSGNKYVYAVHIDCAYWGTIKKIPIHIDLGTCGQVDRALDSRSEGLEFDS